MVTPDTGSEVARETPRNWEGSRAHAMTAETPSSVRKFRRQYAHAGEAVALNRQAMGPVGFSKVSAPYARGAGVSETLRPSPWTPEPSRKARIHNSEHDPGGRVESLELPRRRGPASPPCRELIPAGETAVRTTAGTPANPITADVSAGTHINTPSLAVRTRSALNAARSESLKRPRRDA